MDAVLEARGLTPAEIRVTKEVAKGSSNHAIAARLFVVDKTVKFHLTKIFKKLGIKSRTELIVLVMSLPKDPPPAPKVEPAPKMPDPLPRGL